MRKLMFVFIAAIALAGAAPSARAADFSAGPTSFMQMMLDWMGFGSHGLSPYDTGIGTGE